MTTFACVKVGTKYGPEYVYRLQRGINRHLSSRKGHEFVCFTDDPIPGVLCEKLPADLPGWWAKVGLYKLREPLLYFDLDVVITGSLDPLLEWKGFGIIDDWWMPGFNSSVMKLTGQEGHVFDEFIPEDMHRFRLGDQQWITEQMAGAKTFPPEYFPSYKANRCQAKAPDDAMAVIFHGTPKPCQITEGWVPDLWK